MMLRHFQSKSKRVRLIGLAVAFCVLSRAAVGAEGDARVEPCALPNGMPQPTAVPGGAEEGRERAAQHLLDSARLDLAIGRIADGCRVLVVVATTFGDTSGGRQALVELAHRGREGVAIDGSRSASGWREIVVRATGAQDELREAVGDRVFFADGSVDIGARAADALNAQAGWLVHNMMFDIVVEGHADDGLSEPATQALAAARAEAVRRAFIDRGVPPDRISVLALGSAEPIAACSEPSCAAQNRRAVTRLVPAVVGSAR